MAWSQHDWYNRKHFHTSGRKQQAVFCQRHHRNPNGNVKISEQKNCSEIGKMCVVYTLDIIFRITAPRRIEAAREYPPLQFPR